MEKDKIESLLNEILIELKKLNAKEVIPQIDSRKNLSFLLDTINTRWTSFKPFNFNNVRLFGYHYNSAPLELSAIEEGWVPLYVDKDGKLKVNTS